MRTRPLLATLAVTVACVLLPVHPAAAATRPALRVSTTTPAHADEPALACCGPHRDVTQTSAAAGFGPPSACAPANATGCDVIPLAVLNAPAGSLLKASVGWTAPGVELRVSLWAQDGTDQYRLVEGDYAISAGGSPGVSIDRSSGGELSVFDAQPQPGRYLLVVENDGGLIGVDSGGYHLDLSVELPPVWPLDVAGIAGAPLAVGSEPGVLAGASGARRGTVATGEGSPAASGQLPAASGLDGIRALRTGSAHRLGGLPPLPLALVLLAFGCVAAAGVLLRRQLSRGGVAMRFGVRSWFSNLRLFWKLLVPFVTVILVLGSAGAFLTVRYIASRDATTLDQALLARSVDAENYLRDQELYLLEAERFAANLQGVPEATAARNGAELAKALASAVAVRRNLDVLAATDARGQGLVDFTAHNGTFVAGRGVDWSQAPAVRDVLAGVVDQTGDKQTSFVRLRDGRVLLIIAGPITTTSVVGAAIAGLSAADLADGTAKRTGGQVALFDRSGALMAASAGEQPPAQLSDRFTGGGSVRERHGGHATIYTPLEIRGSQVGTIATTIRTDSAFAAVRGAAYRIGALVALAMLAVVGLGVALSRYILRSLDPLVATNRALGGGDLSARAAVVSGDELGELARGVNLMADQLQESYATLEARVEERTAEVQRLLEQRTAFFASMSHELRTPIAVILGQASMLEGPGARVLTDAGGQLLNFVNDILEIAKAESGRMQLQPMPVALGELVQRLRPTIESLAGFSDLTVSFRVPRSLPAVLADEMRLRQMILNLVDNAVKYTPRGGHISIVVDEAEEMARVSVRDTGVGIPAEATERLFEPFYRVVGIETQGGQPSSGLGLAVVKRLVEAHGGTITFISAPGEGSTFTFTIPVAASSVAVG